MLSYYELYYLANIRVAGLKPTGGHAMDAILTSALCQVWHDCDELFSATPLEAAAETNEMEIRYMEASMQLCTSTTYTEDYNRPHRQLITFLIQNYRRHVYKAHDLKNIRCFIESPGDPLTKTTATGFVANKQTPDPVYKYSPESNTYTKVDAPWDPDELNYKMYNRRHFLYCNGEKAACNYVLSGTAATPIWSNQTTELLRTLVTKYGLDPPGNRRMPLQKLQFHELELRQQVLTGMRDGRWKTWDEGLADPEIKQYIKMEFRLLDPPPPRADRAPPATPVKDKDKKLKDKDKDRYQPYQATPIKKEPGDKGKGKGAPGGRGKNDPRFLQKDETTGQGLCIEFNHNRPCKVDGCFKSPNCKYLNHCNWIGCYDRTKCKGSWWHLLNPGKGLKQ